MANQLALEELLRRNDAHSDSHVAPPTFARMAELGVSVTKTLILSCADPRTDPSHFFNLTPGEAIVFRNAGGQIRPLFNDLLAIDHLIGLEKVLIVHHTDCGTLQWTDDDIRTELKLRNPDAAKAADVEHAHFCAISDIEASVLHDVAMLKNSGLVRKELKAGVKGFVYEIETGKLRAINDA